MSFPVLNVTFAPTEERVTLRKLHGSQPLVLGRTSFRKLGQKVFPFVLDLSGCHRNDDKIAYPGYFGFVESIAAGGCFTVDPGEIDRNRRYRRGLTLEPE